MLRESALATQRPVELRGVVDAAVDPLLSAGVELIGLVDAAIDGDEARMASARLRLTEEAGFEGLVDAAGVFGNFEMMNRIADATGMPVGRGSLEANADLIDQLDLERMRHD